jgi:single-stranded-DNA-specific exonuclease
MNVEEKKEFFLRMVQGKIDIILTTPEFLVFHVEKFVDIKNRLGLFVVDEAHHLAKGKRRGYRQLKKAWNTLGRPLALAVTATADDETAQKIIDTVLCECVVIEEHIRKNLKLIDRRREGDKLAYLIKLIAEGERVVVYVNSRKQSFQIASELRSYYPPVKDEIAFYHGGLHSQHRKRLEEMFRSGELRVMVTTSAFGEGIDIPDIKHVVLYHLCFSRTEFNQLSGRAGRNNEEAFIHILFGEKDKTLNELILEGTVPSREMLGKVYLFIRDKMKETNPLALTNSEIREAMQKAGIKNFREQTASASLAILEEMGLVLREVEGNKRYIHFVPPPQGKLDLTDSVRYLEGMDEWDEFVDFAGSVLNETEDDILAKINKPIYPRETLKLQSK